MHSCMVGLYEVFMMIIQQILRKLPDPMTQYLQKAELLIPHIYGLVVKADHHLQIVGGMSTTEITQTLFYTSI